MPAPLRGLVTPDTNVIIRALRDREDGHRFRSALFDQADRVALTAVVEMELLAGARTPAQRVRAATLIDAIADDTGRLVPSATAYAQAGRVLADLAAREGVAPASARPSFALDVLLACTCREHDAVLLTENAADFSRIQRHLRGFRFVTEWPA
jgi:predicted nucleic acid-binding protein